MCKLHVLHVVSKWCVQQGFVTTVRSQSLSPSNAWMCDRCYWRWFGLKVTVTAEVPYYSWIRFDSLLQFSIHTLIFPLLLILRPSSSPPLLISPWRTLNPSLEWYSRSWSFLSPSLPLSLLSLLSLSGRHGCDLLCSEPPRLSRSGAGGTLQSGSTPWGQKADYLHSPLTRVPYYWRPHDDPRITFRRPLRKHLHHTQKYRDVSMPKNTFLKHRSVCVQIRTCQ